MDKAELKGAFEAILFASPLPVDADRLAAVFCVSGDEAESVLMQIAEDCEKNDRGISLINKCGRYRFITKEKYFQTTASYISSRKARLSGAALEALAIAAYNQPVTKTYISRIRGVSSGEIVDALTEKGLLSENGKLDLPGNPMSYVTTDKFLTVFNLDSLEDLPEKKFIAEGIDGEICDLPDIYGLDQIGERTE